MGTVTRQGSISAHPTSYDSSNIRYESVSSSYPLTNGETDSNSSTYAQVDWTTGQNAETYVYYLFDFSAVPVGATIKSVSAKAKGRVSSTNNAYATSRQMQLYSGTTAKGSALTITGSSTERTFTDVGTWTRADLQNARIRYYVKRGTSNTTSNYTLRMYGATMTVTYEYQETTYDITASGDGTIDPTSETVEAGGSCEIRISGVTNPTVKDNGVDVTSQLDTTTEVTEDAVPDGNTSTGFTVSNISNAYTDADSDTYADLTLAGRTTGTLYLAIDSPTIPSGATIKGVSVEATLQFVPGSSTSGFTASCQMYAGSTAKGSATTVVTSSTAVPKTKFELSPGTWTESEIANARFYLTATNNASSTQRHMYVFGVTFSVTYESDGITYIYTISNVQGNHTVVVTDGTPAAPPVITVGTPTRTIISDETGYDQCICTFTSDQNLQQWEARATKAGVTPGRGIGLLVESGATLSAGATGTVIVDNEELTQGDGEYTITVYGQSTGGIWSQ